MPYGRFAGCPLTALPDEYLDWLLERKVEPFLEQALKAEDARRNGARGQGIFITPRSGTSKLRVIPRNGSNPKKSRKH